jgi:GNAT superfamily N-acetyltransferase
MALPGADVLERAGLKAWPGIEVKWDGSWVRRASNGHTKRANSTQCFDPTDGEDASARIAAARSWYEARGLQPTFRVNRLTSPALADALDAEGWTEIDHSRVVAMELGQVEPDPRGEVLAIDDPVFLEAQQRLRDYDGVTLGKLRAILAVLEVPARGIVLHAEDGRPVASALMAVADGIVITGNVVTATSERRKGYAAATMRSGLAWAVDAGATMAALNVQAGNAAALALYGSLGYAHQYDYCYRTPSTP